MKFMRIAIFVGALSLIFARGNVAIGQPPSPPVLTVEEAITVAMKGNRRVKSSDIDVQRAAEGTAAAKTLRLPQFNLYFLGGETLRPISFTIPQGVLGTYPSIGPIPALDSKITTPRTFTGLVLGQAVQPVSQLWKIHLGILESKIGEELAREQLRQQQQDTAHSIRDLYYQIAQVQTRIESVEANVKYLTDLQIETDRNLAQQSALKADSLAVKAKLSRQRYQLLTLRDTLQNQKESLNQLLGRDLNTDFKVEPQPMPSETEIDLAAAQREAVGERRK